MNDVVVSILVASLAVVGRSSRLEAKADELFFILNFEFVESLKFDRVLVFG